MVFGDFNVVRRAEERLHSVFCQKSAADFNHFIHETGLNDFNMGDSVSPIFVTTGQN